MTTVAIGILACVAVVAVLSWGSRRVVYQPVVQSDLGFTTNDDYYSVVNKLGVPTEDKWRSELGEMQYRRLSYPQQGLSVILMGSDRKDMHYVGAMDKDWKVIHSIDRDTGFMLRKLKRF